MNENVSIRFNSKFVPVKPINDEMTLCKCYVMALGKNSNRSNISKNAADDALPTIFNIPVVGHIYVDDDGVQHMGGHDTAIVKNEDGKYVFKSLTVPYGTVPYQDNIHYEEVEEADGSKSTYLVADVILWTGRYPELFNTIYNQETFFNQSMEIKPLETKERKDGYKDIKKYSYKALCLLGKDDDDEYNVTPCFPSSRVEPYVFSLSEKWDELFEEFRNKLGESYSLSCGFEEGGNITMDFSRFDEILKEFNIEKIEDLSFEVTEEMTEEEFRNKMEEAYSNGEANSTEENIQEPVDFEEAEQTETVQEQVAEQANEETPNEEFEEAVPAVEEEPVETSQEIPQGEFELLSSKKMQKLCAAVKEFNVHKPGYCEHWGVCDYDDQYVYCYCDITDGCEYKWSHYRFAYEEAELEVSVNKESSEEVDVMWLTKEEALKLDKERHEYTELVAFKESQLEENKRKEYSLAVSEFADLEDVQEYKEIVAAMLSFESVDALKEKLYAVRGKTGRVKSKQPVDTVKIPVNFSKNEEESAEHKFMRKYYPEAIKK